ncbi:hypothetical protein [Escherichia phage vB-Eco-KMB46]|nr:hypothetical protein G3B1_075 [Escherichia phage vB_EcoS-G3B1]WQN06676.1 hypothetical protein [Escherichia phage vB-Eco-KMB46]
MYTRTTKNLLDIIFPFWLVRFDETNIPDTRSGVLTKNAIPYALL